MTIEEIEILQIRALQPDVSIETARYLQHRKELLLAKQGRFQENNFVKPSFWKRLKSIFG